MDAILVDDVAKTYRSGLRRTPIHALDGLSLRVAPGEIFGLLGPNGAGKTTLVKILLSVVRPTRGQAALFGVPASDPRARLRIGFLPENHRFPGFLTAGQMLDLYGRMAGLGGEERRTRSAELLERTGMAKWRDTRIRKFSKGMMQRVGLAQALMNRPDLVLLDEPTDGVDPIGRREIKELLLWLRGEGTTVFLNSHLLSEVEQVCTRVAILNDGRLVREGTVDALTTASKEYELVLTALSPELRAEFGDRLHDVGEPVSDPAGAALERYRTALARPELNALLDRLRTAGVEVEAVRPHRRSLEDYFVDVVRSGATGAADASSADAPSVPEARPAP